MIFELTINFSDGRTPDGKRSKWYGFRDKIRIKIYDALPDRQYKNTAAKRANKAKYHKKTTCQDKSRIDETLIRLMFHDIFPMTPKAHINKLNIGERTKNRVWKKPDFPMKLCKKNYEKNMLVL